MAHAGRTSDDRVLIRKQDRIGATDAEEDGVFLERCFVDTGDLKLLRDCDRPERIVLGRTGCGKSALLLRLLSAEPLALEVKPENLALSYVANSTILQFFESLGVRLDPFYKLIWRHALCVEILRKRFGFKHGQERFPLIDKLRDFFRGGQHASAMEYLERWGNTFWEETEFRVKEITKRVEDSLSASLKVPLGPTEMSTGDILKLSEEQKIDVVQRAQKVVNEAHAPQLNQLLDIVRDALDNPQQRFFVVIDRLDDSWAEESMRYKLIMALLDTVKEFKRVPNAKIVIAIRVDLLQRVYKRARTSGFQEEKFDSLCLKLSWTSKDLARLLDARINHVFRDRYAAKKPLTASDLIVDSKNGVHSTDYIFERTFFRPRDVICFFNECVAAAVGKTKIAMKDIRSAELAYSNGRLKSVSDEWHGDYPGLVLLTKTLLTNAQKEAPLASIVPESQLNNRCLQLHGQEILDSKFSDLCCAVVDSRKPSIDLLRAAILVFYKVGISGVKLSSTESVSWFAETGRGLEMSDITPQTHVAIHPMFWRALGVNAEER